MLQTYSIVNGRIEQGSSGALRINVYIHPDETERRFLIDECLIDEHTLLSSTDPDETPRIEFEENHAAIILKYPKNYSAEDNFFFRVKSMGLFLFHDGRIFMVVDDHVPLFTGRPAVNLKTAQDILLRILQQCIRHFESHLRIINMCSDEIEYEISRSNENKNLLNMFTLEKGLVYYINALNGNRRVIEKMKAASKKLGFDEEHLEFLEDLAIENHQFLDQADVYSQVLSGLMDARASIINNNLNVMMKNMNAIMIAISIPTFLTGVGGMSEFTSLIAGRQWLWAYPVFCACMILLGFLIYLLITKFWK